MSTSSSHPHLGRIIERMLQERGMTKAEFSRRINTSRQNVSLILKKRSLDSEMLWRSSLVLHTNLFQLVSRAFGETGQDHAPAATGKLEIRLEIADHKLAGLTTDLIRQVVEEHHPVFLETPAPDHARPHDHPSQ